VSDQAEAQRARHPRPGITHDNRFFWEGLRRRELRIQRCAACHQLQHPPLPICRACRGLDLDWVRSTGRGVIHSFVVAQHPPVPPFSYPNVIVLVELEEGTRLVSRLVGVEPDDVAIGQPVAVDFEEVDGGDLALHFFRPAAG
jgi:uncharacterized OB-fold protein